MITENAIQEAIAYYQGKLDPKRDDAVALAACYILQDHLFPRPRNMAPAYSYATPPELPETHSRQSGETTVGDYGDSDFLQAIHGKAPAKIWPVMDELMSTLWAINPPLYSSVMRKLNE